MNPVVTALIIGIVLGLLAGSYLGRRRAEAARAMSDMQNVWSNRHRYRK